MAWFSCWCFMAEQGGNPSRSKPWGYRYRPGASVRHTTAHIYQQSLFVLFSNCTRNLVISQHFTVTARSESVPPLAQMATGA